MREKIDYLLYLPEEEVARPLPLLLFLHGGGESGDHLEAVKTHGPRFEIEQGRDYPMMVISPLNPDKKGFWDEDRLARFLDALEEQIEFDHSRLYLAGMSRGGYGAYRLAMENLTFGLPTLDFPVVVTESRVDQSRSCGFAKIQYTFPEMKPTNPPMLLWGLSIICSLFVISCLPDQVSSESPDSQSSSGETAAKIEHIDVSGAAMLLASENKPIVLDVRTPEEFEAGHIEGAKMIDFKAPDFESKLADLDREAAYLVHCKSGARSTSSLAVFEKLGFKQIIHLDGGFNAWQEAGNPVVQ